MLYILCIINVFETILEGKNEESEFIKLWKFYIIFPFGLKQ